MVQTASTAFVRLRDNQLDLMSNPQNEIGSLSATEKFELLDMPRESVEADAPALTDEQRSRDPPGYRPGSRVGRASHRGARSPYRIPAVPPDLTGLAAKRPLARAARDDESSGGWMSAWSAGMQLGPHEILSPTRL